MVRIIKNFAYCPHDRIRCDRVDSTIDKARVDIHNNDFSLIKKFTRK